MNPFSLHKKSGGDFFVIPYTFHIGIVSCFHQTEGSGFLSTHKRAILYILRKREKSLTLFLLLMLISSFVTVGFSIVTGTQAAARELRETVGASFRLRGMLTGLVSDDSSGYNATATPVTDTEIDQILQIGGIKAHNTIQSAKGASDDFFYLSGAPYGPLSANRETELNPDFISKLYQLTEGRHIGTEDKCTAIISKALADENKLRIGDSVLLKAVTDEADGADTAVTVIGLYDVDERQEPSKDTIFIDRHTFSELCETRQAEYDTVTFYVGDPADLPVIVEQVKAQSGINWENYILSVQDDEYDSISSQLASVERLVTILIAAVVFVSLIILTLILTMRVQGRIYETGVLLSIGTPKREIIVQLIIETALLAIFAFMLSYPASNIAALQIERNMLSAITDINIGLPFWKVMFIYCIEIAVIVAAVMVSSLSVMRLKPKEILSKMS